MPSTNSSRASRVATCEDYDSDNSVAVQNTLTQANVKAKRSDPSDLRKTANSVASDSGYSTHTAATMSSADSFPRSKKGASASAVPPAPAPPTSRSDSQVKSSKRRSLQAEKVITTHSQAPPSLSRTSSSRKSQTVRPESRPKPRTSRREREDTCPDPGCPQCEGGSYRESGRYSPGPSSPTASRRPTGTYYAHGQGPAVIQPAQTARRRSSSTSRPPPTSRPNSYHGGSMWQQQPQQQQHQQYGGPPLSGSAWANMSTRAAMQQPQMHPFPPFGQTPPNPSSMQYYHTQMQAATAASAFDAGVSGAAYPRPPLPQRATDTATYSTRRPHSTYGPPVISYDSAAAAAAAANQSTALVTQRPSARYAKPGERVTSKWESDTPSESSEDEEDEYSEDEGYSGRMVDSRELDARAMPPPPRKLPRQTSSQIANGNPFSPSFAKAPAPQALELPYSNGQREYRDRSRTLTTATSSRTSSNRRPSIASSRTGATSYSGTSSANSQMIVEAVRGRRISYQGHERRQELEDKHNMMFDVPPSEPPTQYYPHYEERPLPGGYPHDPTDYPVEYRTQPMEYRPERKDVRLEPKDRRLERPVVEQNGRRNSRVMYEDEGDQRRFSKQANDFHNAENYISSRSGDHDPVAELLRAKNAKTQAEVARSKRNSRVPSDEKSTASRSSAGRTTVTKDTSGAIKIGIEQGQNMTLQFDGPMDGKTLQIRQNEHGMSELVIATAGMALREKQYHPGSEARSKVGSKLTTRERVRDDSVSERGSRKSDKSARGRRPKREQDYYETVHGA